MPKAIAPQVKVPSAIRDRFNPAVLSDISTSTERLAHLNEKYSPAHDQARAGFTRGMAGMGGYKLDAEGNVVEGGDRFGQREREGIQGEKNRAASRGTLHSTRTHAGISDVVNTFSLRKQEVINSYAGSVNRLIQEEAQEYSDIARHITGLYGTAMEDVIDRVPPEIGDEIRDTARPGRAKQWIGKNAPNQRTLDSMFGPDNWKITRPGGGGYLVRPK